MEIIIEESKYPCSCCEKNIFSGVDSIIIAIINRNTKTIEDIECLCSSCQKQNRPIRDESKVIVEVFLVDALKNPMDTSLVLNEIITLCAENKVTDVALEKVKNIIKVASEHFLREPTIEEIERIY